MLRCHNHVQHFPFLPPATKLGKVMFSQACVILFTGGDVCLSACWDTTPPRSRHPTRSSHPPPEQTPPTPPEQTLSPWEQTPPEQTPPLEQTPPSRHPPPSRQPPQRRACWEIRSTRGRYASYWNAILFRMPFLPKKLMK